MCRLALMNKNGEIEIEENYGLTNFFSYLEASYGGHGNGFSLLRDGKVICLKKGLNLSVKDIANVIRKTNYDWCIFHTRAASVGSKKDSNCHPFMIGTEVMAMNGTEQTEKLLTKVKDITDTEAILRVKEKFNLEIPALRNLSSIFVGFSKGRPYVVANNTHNIKLMYKSKNRAIVFASEFPDKLKNNIYAAKTSFIWNDEPINMFNFREYIKEKNVKFNPMQFMDYEALNFRQATFDEYGLPENDFKDDLYYKNYQEELEEYEREVLLEYEEEQRLEKLARERKMKDAA